MEFRNLEINDYYRGYLDLLSQLHRPTIMLVQFLG